MNYRYLYRGVNPEMHRSTGGRLRPKAHGKPFCRRVHFGEDVAYGSGAVYGESARNAVLMHQRDSTKYPSSGVSTTPNFDNAKVYATNYGEYSTGIVYKIDTELLAAYGVMAYQVDEHATVPKIPEDHEVILVARDGMELPEEVVVDFIEV